MVDRGVTMSGRDARAGVEAEMQRLLEAADTLRADLEGHQAVCRSILAGIRRGERLEGLLEANGSRTWRPRITDSLTTYERLRHRARLRLIALGVEEGMTVQDIQQHWSITKQLANRALREIEHLDEPG
jgi:hypothetical protein